METRMKIDGDVVRGLREQKSWSQEHLANASGLSVRTVQRVEVESVGSAETRLALAAALGVPVADLIAEASPSTAPIVLARRLPLWGWLGWGIGVIFSIAAVAYGYRQGAFPTDQVAPNILPWIAFFGICAGAMAAWAGWRHQD
jgi:transcriptional regulator with XRE-family HTH domain